MSRFTRTIVSGFPQACTTGPVTAEVSNSAREAIEQRSKRRSMERAQSVQRLRKSRSRTREDMDRDVVIGHEYGFEAKRLWSVSTPWRSSSVSPMRPSEFKSPHPQYGTVVIL